MGGAGAIANRVDRDDTRIARIQIRSQILRETQSLARLGDTPGFELMPNKDNQPEAERAQSHVAFTQVDVQRAISAARDAGLKDYRVEIAPGGTISIVVGAAARAADGTTVFDSSAS